MNVHLARRSAAEKPTVGRCLIVLLSGWLVATGTRPAQGSIAPLTERDVVERTLRRAAFTDAIEGAVEIEAGRARTSRAYPNPQLNYLREQTFGTSGTGEDYLSIAQVIDLGGRRRFQGKAGDLRARAAEQDGDAVRLAAVAEARLRFFDVLYRQDRVAALEGWRARIDEALAIVARRESKGDASTYERRRLERERAVATGRLDTERATLERARAQLHALLGDDAPRGLRVTGSLLPAEDPEDLAALRRSSRSRPDLRALDLEVRAASFDRKSASRWFLPDLRVEGGWKGVDLGRLGRTDGFLLGAALTLPLWDRQLGLARIAQGEARSARGRRALAESEIERELEGVRAEAVLLRRAATEFRAETTAASADLVRTASAGYVGGELGLLELLDAYRGAADDSLGALDMDRAARRARIDLDRLTGTGLP